MAVERVESKVHAAADDCHIAPDFVVDGIFAANLEGCHLRKNHGLFELYQVVYYNVGCPVVWKSKASNKLLKIFSMYRAGQKSSP